jgi:hypothetical protein
LSSGGQLPRGHAVHFGIGDARGIGDVEDIEIDTDIGRTRADDAPNLGGNAVDALVDHILQRDDGEVVAGPLILRRVSDRAVETELYGPSRVDQFLLHPDPERCTSVMFRAAGRQIRIGMGVEMNHADRACVTGMPTADRAQDRGGDRMVSADGDWNDAALIHALEAVFGLS